MIVVFRSTEDAVQYGELIQGVPELAAALRAQRELLLGQTRWAKNMQRRLELLTQAQFCREALLATDGTVSSASLAAIGKGMGGVVCSM